jgi:hypothetical protein
VTEALLELPAAFFGALFLYRFACGCLGLEGGFHLTVTHVHGDEQ